MSVKGTENIKSNPTSSSVQPIVLIFLLVVAGLLIALPLLPGWTSNLSFSFTGNAPRIYWYLSRSAGIVALTILWASMAFGLGLTNKLARLWPGAPTAFAIHEFVSLLGIAFVAYHALVLMGDHYTDFSLPKLLVPFSIDWLPTWIGLGQLGFYIWLFVALSFYVRQRIGQKVWRMIHYANFATYVMGLLHGLFTGTDSSTIWARGYYLISGGSLLILLVYRIHASVSKKPAARPQTAVTANQVQPAQAVSAAEKVDTVPSPARNTPPLPAQVPVVTPVAAASARRKSPPAVPAVQLVTGGIAQSAPQVPSQAPVVEPAIPAQRKSPPAVPVVQLVTGGIAQSAPQVPSQAPGVAPAIPARKKSPPAMPAVQIVAGGVQSAPPVPTQEPIAAQAVPAQVRKSPPAVPAVQIVAGGIAQNAPSVPDQTPIVSADPIRVELPVSATLPAQVTVEVATQPDVQEMEPAPVPLRIMVERQIPQSAPLPAASKRGVSLPSTPTVPVLKLRQNPRSGSSSNRAVQTSTLHIQKNRISNHQLSPWEKILLIGVQIKETESRRSNRSPIAFSED
jgi:hypothetical protein